MSKYEYEIDPDMVDLVDDGMYDESDLDGMSSEGVWEIARDILADRIRVRRI